MRVSVFAPAKINLSLHVGPRRADGRHPLTSAVVFADVGDRLYLERGANSLDVTGPFASGLSGENLISRALALAGESARVELEKNLPVASGIGGGSADAAAALRAIALLTGRTLDIDAARLGSDVPVCLACTPAWMTGAGEVVSALRCADLHAVLVNPGIALETPGVYRKFDELRLGADLSADEAPDLIGDPLSALARLRNDLEAPACHLAPEISQVLGAIAAAPGVRLARMSGSGATCFGLTRAPEAAMAAAERLARDRPKWWVRAARLGAVDAAPRAL